MRLLGVNDFKFLKAKIKLLGDKYPHYLQSTKGVWLETPYTVGFFELRFDAVNKVSLPFKTIDSALSDTHSILNNNIAYVEVDTTNKLFIYHQDDIICAVLLLNNGIIKEDLEDRVISSLTRGNDFRDYILLKSDFSIKEV